MRKCKICSSDLVAIGSKLVCSNEKCAYQEGLSKISWFKRFAENKTIWENIALGKVPSVIGLQYERLRDLLKADELYGAQIKVKDIYEIEIKFLVLIILSEAFNNDKIKQIYAPHIYDLMKANPSLGTWLALAKQLYQLNDSVISPIYKILKSLIEYDNKEHIVAWRNANIGHGFLMLESEISFQDSLKEKIESLVNNFINNLDLYSEVRLCTKLNNILIDVNDKNILENDLDDVNELFILVENRELKLIPLIQCYKSSVYFFDSYIVKKAMTKYLASSTNDKYTLLEKKLSDMFSSVKILLHMDLVDNAADEGLFIEENIKRVDELVTPSIFFRYDFINKHINEWLKNYNNGNFLIEMKAGMGKTTFVKMADQLSYNNFQIGEDILCRAFYINSIYGYSKEYFINSLTNSLLETNSGEHITGNLPQINLYTKDAKYEFAQKINSIFRYYKQKLGIKKLVIFIDGLDEIPYSVDSTIADIIPTASDLDVGIYFIFTSRLISDDISVFTKNKVLNQLNFQSQLCVNPQTDVFNDYKDNLFKSIIKQSIISAEDASRLIELSNNNALELQYLISLYNDLGSSIFNDIKESNNFIDFYWSSIRSLFGENYYTELLSVVKLLSFTPVPISIKSIAELLGESNITFKLQAFINTLKHWITSIRTGQDTLLQITRPEVVEWVKKESTGYLGLLSVWKKNLDLYADTEIRKLDNDELRIFTIELLAVLQFDIQLFNDKYKNILELYLVQLKMHMLKMSEIDYSLHRIVFLKINKYIEDKHISLDPRFQIGMYLDFGQILKQAGFFNDITIYMSDFINRLHDHQKVESAGLVWNLYQLIAQSFDLEGNTRNAVKYFDLAKVLQGNYIKSTNQIADKQSISLIDEYNSLMIQLQTAVSYKNNSNYYDALIILHKIIKQCDELKQEADESMQVKFDEILLNAYNISGNVYKRRDPDTALYYFKLAEELTEKLGGIDRFNNAYSRYISLGQLYRVRKEYDLALEYYNKAWECIAETKESDVYVDPSDEINLYNSIANIHRDKQEYQEAISYYSKGIDLFEKSVSKGRCLDKTIYIMLINNRRGMYHRLKVIDLFERDNEILYRHYKYINWNKMNHTKVDMVDTTLINDYEDYSSEDYTYLLPYEAQSDVSRLIESKQFDKAISILEEILSEDLPMLKCLDDLAFCYGEIGDEAKAIELNLLFIILCNYNYNKIANQIPRNSLIKLSSLGVKGDPVIIELAGMLYTMDSSKKRNLHKAPLPQLGEDICGKLGYTIPVYFRNCELYSIAIMFYELGCFAIRKIVSSTEMPLFPHLVFVDEKRTMLKPLKKWLNYILDKQNLNSQKASELYLLASKFYKGDVDDSDRREYINSWRIIKNNYILEKTLDLLPDIYIALELGIRSMQYGSKKGKELVVSIYQDKSFDRYNISISKFIEKLKWQFTE
ncbi:MAG: tetratricopeptide repeat protein [Veillonella dispar]|nr:tetratricopeptide repeat protein [Veillonella dispar]